MLKSLTDKIRSSLPRGEATVAFVGLSTAGILLLVIVACATWVYSASKEALIDSRMADLQKNAVLLAAGLEQAMSDNDLSSARRLVLDAGQKLGLEQCAVKLSDQQTLADLHPAHINVKELPASWVFGASTQQPIETRSGQVHLTMPLRVAGRGAAVLELTALPPSGEHLPMMLQFGIGAIGAAGLCMILLVYRTARRRLTAVEVVRESLLAFGAGETSIERLSIDPSLGAEAAGWNRLLEERKGAQQISVVNRVNEKISDRRSGRGDLGTACDSLSQGLVLLSEDLRVQFSNGAAAALLKRRRSDLNQLPITDLISEPKVLDAIRSVAQQGMKRAVTVEVENDKEGLAVFKYSIRPVRNEDNGAAMIVIEDVTQQRVADRSRNAFINQVTHELRTPLTNIRLYVETAIEEVNRDQSAVEKALNVINSEASRLERIVSEMLSMAEIEAGCMKLKADDVRLETLFAELRADYQAQADDKNIKLVFNLPPKFPVVTGDRDRIVLALHNLVGNALKYTMKGGTVTVTAESKDGRFVIEVADTGIGINGEELERIFDRFYRARDPRVASITGTGLGLTLAREVIRMHGGDVTAESQLDHGSTFIATLPLRKEAA